MDRSFAVFSFLVVVLLSLVVMSSKITGDATANVGVTVQCLIAISLPVNVVDFGTLSQGASDNTTDNSPQPLVIQNDGGALADVTIARANGSSIMFNGTGGGDNSSSFRFKARDPNATSFNASGSIIIFTPVPGTTPVSVIKQLRFASGHNKALIDLLVDVPYDEPPGSKSELLDFIASQSAGFDCGEDPFVNATQAMCISFNTSGAGVCSPSSFRTTSNSNETKEPTFGTECIDCYFGNGINDVDVRNNCNSSVKIAKARLNWTNSSAKIEKLMIGSTTQWMYNCYWGCSPLGRQVSGTLLDFGSNDKTISSKSYSVLSADFDASVRGSTFRIELVMADGSHAFSGSFVAS